MGGSFRARHHSVTKSPGCSVNLKEPETQEPIFIQTRTVWRVWHLYTTLRFAETASPRTTAIP